MCAASFIIEMMFRVWLEKKLWLWRARNSFEAHDRRRGCVCEIITKNRRKTSTSVSSWAALFLVVFVSSCSLACFPSLNIKVQYTLEAKAKCRNIPTPVWNGWSVEERWEWVRTAMHNAALVVSVPNTAFHRVEHFAERKILSLSLRHCYGKCFSHAHTERRQKFFLSVNRRRRRFSSLSRFRLFHPYLPHSSLFSSPRRFILLIRVSLLALFFRFGKGRRRRWRALNVCL